MNLIFCGLPKSGKSTFAQKTATHLSWPFIDTDALIEKAELRPCRDIYLKYGETYFRSVEKRVLLSLLEAQKSVISLGGGTLSHDTLAFVKSLGTVIYLIVSPAVAWHRMSTPPPYAPTENDFYLLAKARELLYETAADVTIGSSTLDETWQAIRLAIFSKLQLGENPTEKPSVLSSMDAQQE